MEYSTIKNIYPVDEKSGGVSYGNAIDAALITTELTGGLRTKKYYKKDLPDKPLITIITCVLNGEKYIEETILSVLYQTYDNVEYLIIDGGSTDSTVDIIRKYEQYVDFWISERDKGLYDALAKGISLSSGSICGYINAGDLYHRTALTIVSEALKIEGIEWITGLRVKYNEVSDIADVTNPLIYESRLIRAGVYGKFLPYIQQESTFWKAKLNKEVNWECLRTLKFAGDYYLWHAFAKRHKLFVVNAMLGGFRKHSGQLTERLSAYRAEIETFRDKMKPGDFIRLVFHGLLWCCLSEYLRKHFTKCVHYSFSKKKWMYGVGK
ncbi:MAG: glycosyltransferase family 2 protein [Syntrophales bacterium]